MLSIVYQFLRIYIKQRIRKINAKKTEFVLKLVIWTKGHIYLWTDPYDIFLLIAVKPWISTSLACFTVKAQTLFSSFAKSMQCHYMWFINTFIELVCFNFGFNCDSIIYYQRKSSHRFFRKALHFDARASSSSLFGIISGRKNERKNTIELNCRCITT